MSAVLNAGTAVVGVSALSLLGLFALTLDQARVHALVPLLTSLAAGALVGGAVCDLIPEALARGASPSFVALAVIAGFLGLWALERGLHRAATRREATPDASRHAPIVMLNFIGDALHNAADGSIIAAAFLATPTVGIVTTLAIVLHEIPRELGSFGIFVHGGVSVRRAVAYNALTGITAMASAALTLLFGTRTALVATTLLPIAAGTFLYIPVAIVPPMILRAPSARQRALRLALALMTFVAVALAARLG